MRVGLGNQVAVEVPPVWQVPEPVVQHLVGDTEVVQHLLGACGEPLAARTGEVLAGSVDDAHVDAPAGQLDGQREPGGSGTRDQDVGHRSPS